ncbi:MAG: helix-turn-helix transcriptional regulator [Clostridia bacterium]|nr:helix-turn-helix transcriptional regulator [Clostridia bacterium]
MIYFDSIKKSNELFACRPHTRALKNDFACTLDMHIQPTIEMVYVIDGKFDSHINGKTETIHTGEIGIIFPFQPHGYQRYEGSDYLRFDFDTELAADFFSFNRDKVGEKAVFKASEVTEFTIKKNFIEGTGVSRLIAQNLIYSILSDFTSQVKLVPTKKDGNALIKAITYIKSNTERDIQMSTVAKALGYSESYFSRAINKTAGFGFNTLLAMIRVENAKKLLRETKKSMLEIVLECGFGSERSFYRQFKELTGISPLKYKNINYK